MELQLFLNPTKYETTDFDSANKIPEQESLMIQVNLQALQVDIKRIHTENQKD